MNKGMTDMSMKQHILEYIDSAIESADDTIEHAFKYDNILMDWAQNDIRDAIERKIQLKRFREAFAQGIPLKGSQAESYSRIMCEAVEIITSYED
jgi:hypothetical protein